MIVSALLIHFPFIVQLGGALASMFVAIPAFNLPSAFVKAWLSMILFVTLVITVITVALYVGLIVRLLAITRIASKTQ